MLRRRPHIYAVLFTLSSSSLASKDNYQPVVSSQSGRSIRQKAHTAGQDFTHSKWLRQWHHCYYALMTQRMQSSLSLINYSSVNNFNMIVARILSGGFQPIQKTIPQTTTLICKTASALSIYFHLILKMSCQQTKEW